jgi:hypothetical protein
MLQVEDAAGKAARATIRNTLARTSDPITAAQQIRHDLPNIIVATRVTARRAGNTAMQVELGAVRSSLTSSGVWMPSVSFEVPTVDADDYDAATEIANNYADDMIRLATTPERSTLSAIIAALTYRVDTFVTTETSQQFSQQRARNERDLRGEYKGTAWLPLLVKIWDGTLDRRICVACSARVGKTRPVGFDWDGLEPGMPHPGCRCQSHYFGSILYAGAEYAA